MIAEIFLAQFSWISTIFCLFTQIVYIQACKDVALFSRFYNTLEKKPEKGVEKMLLKIGFQQKNTGFIR